MLKTRASSSSDLWSVSISAHELPNTTEYKYVLIEGDQINKWGAGDNKMYNLNHIKAQIKSMDITETVEFESNNSKILFGPTSRELVILDSFD